jgi:hypothetical protein
VGQREREALGDELLDVRALDIIGLLNLDNTEDLHFILATAASFHIELGVSKYRTWIDRKRARWRAAMSE